jgi:hypothetical protein
MTKLRNDILTTEAKRFASSLILDARGVTSKVEDKEAMAAHIAEYLENHAVPENILREVTIDNLVSNIYTSTLNSAAKSRNIKQGDLFGSGLPQVILIRNSDTYIRFDMATENHLEVWINQKRLNVRAAQQALYIDEDIYQTLIDEMRTGVKTAGEAVKNIQEKAKTG